MKISAKYILTGFLFFALLSASGCATPDYRYPQQVKPHAQKGLITLQTLETGYETIYYSCKAEGDEFVCQKACGDKFRCPMQPGYVQAHLSKEARQSKENKTAKDSKSAKQKDKKSPKASGKQGGKQ